MRFRIKPKCFVRTQFTSFQDAFRINSAVHETAPGMPYTFRMSHDIL